METKNYVSYKDKFNKKYGYTKGKSHTLAQVSKDTGVSLKGLQQIYNKGIGAYKTNPQSVRPNVKSKEQWAMARVYSSVMGGKASKIDANELKMETGGMARRYDGGGKTDNNQIIKFTKNQIDYLADQVDVMIDTYTNDYDDNGILNEEEADYLEYPETISKNRNDLENLKYKILNEKGTSYTKIERDILISRIDMTLDSLYDDNEVAGGKRSLISAQKKLQEQNSVFEKGGNVGQEITCQNCGWHWNTKDSKDFDKYVCHKCDFDNSPFYLKGGMALDTQTGNNWYSKGGMQRKYVGGGLVPRRNPKGDVILEDAWLITRDEYNEENLITHLPKGTKADKATLKLQDYFAQITNISHTSKVNEAIKKGLYIEAVNSGKMTRQRANEIISSIGNTKDLIRLNETKKNVEGGKITQFEIEAMRNYINGKNPNPKLKSTFEQVLRKYGFDLETGDLRDFPKGRYVDPYDFSGYEHMRNKNEEAGVSFLLTGEYQLVSKAIYEKDYAMWIFYNYLGRINISFQSCREWLKEAQEYFAFTMPIPIWLVHTPKAKDGRSFAMWTAVSEDQKLKAESLIGRPMVFDYRNVWYYNEIGLVANYDNPKWEGWGSFYREKKTGLLVPEYTETSFHFNTLIHEFAHCLDFQSQLVQNIEKYKDRKQSKENESFEVNTEELSDVEKALYANQLKKTQDSVTAPITNHFTEFVDSLIRILRACASGKIPLTQLFEQQALNVQQALSGTYGDLILAQREKKAQQAKEVSRADEVRDNKRFTWQGSWNRELKQYLYDNAIQLELKEKLESNSKKDPYTLSEILELDNMLTNYTNNEFYAYSSQFPSKAQARLDAITELRIEANRIINNHYDNIKNRYAYGFIPRSEIETYIAENCQISDFRDYKSWKECVKEKLQGFQ